MQWNLRMRAAERGIWKSAQMRRMLADAGLEISAGKMSSWWAGSPPTVRLDELDVLCAVLQCSPSDLLTPEPGRVAARRPQRAETAGGDDVPPRVAPRFGIRAELNSPNPAIALAVALVAFHALTAKQVAGLRLTDIADGRLRLAGRSIPLAQPVRDRLTRWLDHRARTWPHTQNPHLLITRRSAPRLVPVSRTYPWRASGVKPRALRDDRILAEVRATRGDARRLADLFGVGIESAGRYVDTFEHPDLTTPDAYVPGTSNLT